MKWNVIVRDITTGTIGPYNIFDCADFRIAVEKIIAQKYEKHVFSRSLTEKLIIVSGLKLSGKLFSQPGRLILAQRK